MLAHSTGTSDKFFEFHLFILSTCKQQYLIKTVQSSVMHSLSFDLGSKSENHGNEDLCLINLFVVLAHSTETSV